MSDFVSKTWNRNVPLKLSLVHAAAAAVHVYVYVSVCVHEGVREGWRVSFGVSDCISG